MAKNTGKAHEQIVRAIFQAILDQEQVRNAVVKHDVKLEGKSGVHHQVDVYWEFSVGDLVYRTIVSCKDWPSSPVKKDHVLALRGVLDDIPGQPRGVIVSTSGFQEGAEVFANAYGIAAYTLRPAVDADYEGEIRCVQFEMNLAMPVLDKVQLIWDQAWLAEAKAKLGTEHISIPYQGFLGEMRLVDGEGKDVGALADALKAVLPDHFAEEPPSRKRVELGDDRYLPLENAPFPRAKLLALEADIGQLVQTGSFSFDRRDFVEYVLTNVHSGVERRLNPDPKRLPE